MFCHGGRELHSAMQVSEVEFFTEFSHISSGCCVSLCCVAIYELNLESLSFRMVWNHFRFFLFFCFVFLFRFHDISQDVIIL